MKNSILLIIIFFWAVILCNACKGNSPGIDNIDDVTQEYTYVPYNYVRINSLGISSGNGSWLLNKDNGFPKDYNVQDILDMINVMKPDGLERFITGKPNLNEVLPTRKGESALTVVQFLNAAVKAGSEKCQIIPELDLQWFADKEKEALFWESAEIYYNMSLERPIRSIYLDNWVAYCESIDKTSEQRSDMLKKLREIGFVEILADYTANLNMNESGIDGAYLDINPLVWRASDNQLKKVKSYPNIKKVLLHFDSPETVNKFKLNSADKQADILCNTLFPGQKSQGYNFIFPVMEGDYNSRIIYTDKSYNSNSIFEITRDLITKGSFQNTPSGTRDIDNSNPDPNPDPDPDPNLPKRYVRMIVWAKPFSTANENTFPHWMLFQSVAATANDGSWYNLAKDYYAEDVIDLITDLKPHCLERFITGTGNRGPGMPVPTRPGNPAMTFEQFLQKAMDAGAPGCYIVPKLDLTWLGDVKRRGDDPMNDETIFWRSARTLFNLNINPAIRTVCLDCWNNFCENFPTDAERTLLLEKLKSIGFTELQLNYTGATSTNNSLIDVAKWNITTSNWTVNTTALNRFKAWSNIKDYLLYIDYPGAMDAFLTQFTDNPRPGGYADRQADMLINNIVNKQKDLGFTYVYPFFQNGYDPKTFETNPNGKYKGKTMYEIQKELMWYGKVLD